MFAVSTNAKRLATAFTLGVAAVPLASFAPYDPSLAAAPAYEPEKWNDVSNEDLLAFYQNRRNFIEAVFRTEYQDKISELAAMRARGTHAPYEKALDVIKRINNDMAANPFFAPDEVAAYYAHKYNVPQFLALGAVLDARKIYKPLHVQRINNCYAYSANDRDFSKNEDDYQGDPGARTMGRTAATQVNPYYAKNYRAFVQQTIRGTVKDGMIFTGQRMESREGFYRVALYVRPALQDTNDIYKINEFHYVRQNRDGTWSHKYGTMNVMDSDYAGKIITDPAKADMGNYRFIGYFLAPKGGLDVGLPSEKPTKPGSPPSFDPV